MKKLYDQREISRLLGISESQVRYWDRKGLIPHLEKSRGTLWFDFQALVAFRTVRELRRQGVSLAKISKCVAKLRQLMPDLKQPLSEVRISIQQNQIVLGKNRREVHPRGADGASISTGGTVSPFPCRRIPMRTCSFRPWRMRRRAGCPRPGRNTRLSWRPCRSTSTPW